VTQCNRHPFIHKTLPLNPLGRKMSSVAASTNAFV
jgi:hypothetical protein